MVTSIQETVNDVVASCEGAEWSVCLRDEAGHVLAGHDADAVLSLASAGKLLLLAETARQLDTGRLAAGSMLSRSDTVPVGQAGLWQNLLVDRLPLADVAALVSAVSDNLATNVLIDRVGLEHVAALGSALHLTRTKLHDYCRNDRGSNDPPRLSTGSSDELSGLMVKVNAGTLVNQAVCEQMTRWLALNADLSMVAAPLGLDPLAHAHPEHGLLVRNKTGGDVGVLADIGFCRGPSRFVAYAVVANWAGSAQASKDCVLDGMHRVGRRIREHVEPGGPGN